MGLTDKTHSEHNASGVRPLADIDADIDCDAMGQQPEAHRNAMP